MLGSCIDAVAYCLCQDEEEPDDFDMSEPQDIIEADPDKLKKVQAESNQPVESEI